MSGLPDPAGITSVLVPVDPDDGDGRAAEAAVEVAAELAQRAGATVTLVAVDPQAVPLADPHRFLEALAEGPSGGPAVATRVDVTTTSVAGHLARTPEPGEIVCMATHGRTRLGALVLGSVADAVVRRATAPVLLVGPRRQPVDLGRPVVAALDGSERDSGVVAAAAGWAKALGVELVVTTVVTAPSDPLGWVAADEVLAAAVDEAGGLGVTATVDPVAAGDPVSGLLAATDGAGCIVVGSRRRSAVQAVTSSTVHDLVRRSPVPVLVAP
ncbi:MAG TPA: universal stress protein [Iamia sp.]|nr:universal stress protein [Iamia sp.]